MKLITIAIAFGPAALVLVAKFAIEPAWLKEWGLPACVAFGAVIGGFGALSAHIFDPHD